jgi:Protein of unknown function (DUF3365)
MKKIALVVAGVILAAAPLSAAELAPQVRATAAAGRLNLEMRKNLIQSIQKNGLAGSMDVCAKDAPALIAGLEKNFDLSMKRTALRVRNPANSPDAAEKALLEKLAGMQKSDDPLPQEVTLFSETESGKVRTLRYYKPVMMQAPCVGCHGTPDKISAEVKKALVARYPKDKAVGYKEGEVRGIISITVKEMIPEGEIKK